MVVDIDNKPKKENCKVPVKEFLEERAKIHLIKGFGEIKKAAEDFRIIPKIVRDCFLYNPRTLTSRTAFLEPQLSFIIGQQRAKEKENTIVKDFQNQR